jgi:hypothetical protein
MAAASETFTVKAEWRLVSGGAITTEAAKLNAIAAAHVLNELVNSPTPPTSILVATERAGEPRVYAEGEHVFTIGFGAHQDMDSLAYRKRRRWFG